MDAVPSVDREVYRFGPFELDPHERLLTRGDARVALAPKSFELLVVLVRNAGRLVTRDELFASVWPGVSVSEGNLKYTVAGLRRALEDDGAVIETVPKAGYRFTAPVERASEPAGPRPSQAADATARRRIAARRAGIAAAAVAIGAAALLGAPKLGDARLGESRRAAEAEIAARHAARAAWTKGRLLWSRRVGRDLGKSLSLFEEATQRDPRSADAWSGLADACAFDLTRWREAGEYARRALELEPGLGQPHATLGFLALFWEWNGAEADARFGRALELEPGNVSARQWRAALHAARGDFPAARADLKAAERLEPANLAVLADGAWLSYLEGNLDEAVAEARAVSDLDAGFPTARRVLALAHNARGRHEEAVDAWLAFDEISGDGPARVAELRETFRSGGIDAFYAARLLRLGAEETIPLARAEYHALRGDRARALEELEKAVDRKAFGAIFTGVDPVFAFLRGDARFRALGRRIGFGRF